MKSTRIAIVFVFLLTTMSLVISAEKTYSYLVHIVPINIENDCSLCHCGSYRFLCDYSSMMKYVSTENEKTVGIRLVHPGKPDSSVIIWRLEGKLPNGESLPTMPEGRKKLTEEKISLYRKWIEQGALELRPVAVEDTKLWGEIKKVFK